MYVYQAAIAKPIGRNARYRSIDADTVPLAELFNNYTDVRIQLSHTVDSGFFILKLESVRNTMVDLTMTIVDWLNALGALALPVEPGELAINTETFRYKCAFAAGYSVQYTKMGTHPDTDWPRDAMRDLLLTKPKISYDHFQDHCLVTVNGLVHRSGKSEYGIYVVDGAFSNVLSNQNTIGIMNFENIGKLDIVPITDDMIHGSHTGSTLYNKTFVDLPVSSEGKVPLLVIGGYLHVLDEVYRSINDKYMVIDFNRVSLLERHYESMGFIDLTQIDNPGDGDALNMRSTEEIIQSDEYIRKLLTLSQSFIVLVNTEHLYYEYHRLEKLPLPGSFIVHDVPRYPLRTANGKLPEYHSIRDGDRYVIRCVSNNIPNYQFNTTNWQENETVTSAALPDRPYLEDRGFLLEIGKDV